MASREDLYDYHQEVANAGFGDMLHDRERNQKYYIAIRKTIENFHKAGKKANVLDIGTGTGILSMMAVASGADSVTACEAFLPMANCAELILKSNKVRDKITLIKKSSFGIIMGKDMKERANILVAEVLDTELIGEGALGIYNHAHENLLTDDVVCIPSKANCYAQVASSYLAAQWNSLKVLSNLDGDILVRPPLIMLRCPGAATLHDVQLSQLPLEQFSIITDPIKIFSFDFNCKENRMVLRKKNHVVKSIYAGFPDLVFFWWDISVDIEEEIILSCAPFWAHPEFDRLANQKPRYLPLPNVIPWRDHWMQAIYYIPKRFNMISEGEEFILNCNHDEYSWWFDAFPLSEENSKNSVFKHSCICYLHIAYSRSRIGQMNESLRNKKYISYLEDHITPKSKVLVLGDGCILGLGCAKLKVSKLWCHEPHHFSRKVMESIAKASRLSNVEFLNSIEDIDPKCINEITHIFAEPYFLSSILPWDNFHFGTLLMNINEILTESVKVAPFGARVYCLPVEFLDLHKTRISPKKCEGFNLEHFDKMVEESISIVQSDVEAHPLWEYPCRALALPKQVLQVDFRNFNQDQLANGEIPIMCAGKCNGIAIWVDWMLDNSGNEKNIVSTGPTQTVKVKEFIKWDMFVRQGVHFISSARNVECNESTVKWKVDFKPKLEKLNFNFDMSYSKM